MCSWLLEFVHFVMKGKDFAVEEFRGGSLGFRGGELRFHGGMIGFYAMISWWMARVLCSL